MQQLISVLLVLMVTSIYSKELLRQEIDGKGKDGPANGKDAPAKGKSGKESNVAYSTVQVRFLFQSILHLPLKGVICHFPMSNFTG